jgi:hypothetical protein
MSTPAKKLIDSDNSECYKREALDVSQGDSYVSETKPFTFADGYGLGLIARNPQGDWKGIIEHLSDHAQKIANAMIDPGSGSRDARSAAQDLLGMAGKIQSSERK